MSEEQTNPNDDDSAPDDNKHVNDAAKSMSDMISYIAQTLSEDKEAVKVTSSVEGEQVRLSLEVNENDKGRVIGRNGRIAKSMRALLHVAAIKANVRAKLFIV